jgi:hypothetical protein
MKILNTKMQIHAFIQHNNFIKNRKKKKSEQILIPGTYKPDQRSSTRRTHKFSVQIKTQNQYSFIKTQTKQNPHA